MFRFALAGVLFLSMSAVAAADPIDEHPEWFILTEAAPEPGALLPGYAEAQAFLFPPSSGATYVALLERIGLDAAVFILHEGPEGKEALETALVDSDLALVEESFLDVGQLDTELLGDWGPLFVGLNGSYQVVDPRYFPNRPWDDAAGSRLAALWGTCAHRPPLLMNRGLVEADGNGLCVITSKIHSLTPFMSTDEINFALRSYLGCQQIIVVQALQGDSAGRVDTFFRFTSANSALVGQYEAQQDSANKIILESQVLAKLQAALPADIVLDTIAMPDPVVNSGTSYWPSYLAFVQFDGVVLMPVYDNNEEREKEALETFWDHYHPQKEVEKFDATGFVVKGVKLSGVAVPIPAAFDQGCKGPATLCQTNNPAQCGVCFDECLMGETYCLSDSLTTNCTAGEDGCGDLFDSACGALQTCVDGICEDPPDPCDLIPEGGQCDGNIIVKCVNNAVIHVDCENDGQFCGIDEDTSEAVCVVICQDECEGDEVICSDDGKAVIHCWTDSNGCLVVEEAPCPVGTDCMEGACESPETPDIVTIDLSAGYDPAPPKSDGGCSSTTVPTSFAGIWILALLLASAWMIARGARMKKYMGLCCLVALLASCSQSASVEDNNFKFDFGPTEEDTSSPDVTEEDLWTPPVDSKEASPLLHSLETSLSPANIAAGAKAGVNCKGYDAAGNPVDTGPLGVEADNGVDVLGFQITSTMAGKHEVRCVALQVPGAQVAPAVLTVTAGVPETMILMLSPPKSFYSFVDTATVSASGADQYGNVLEDIQLLAVSISPASMGKTTGNKLEFSEEGKGTVKAYAYDNNALFATVDLLVDQYGPEIKVTNPARAATVSGSETIQVVGTITDNLNLEWATFNGAELEVSGGGQFSVLLDAKLGMNLLKLEAEDAAGHKSAQLQSFLYSPKYKPVPKLPLSNLYVEEGTVAWLDYDAFKSGRGSEGTSMSYLVQEFLVDIDLGALLPNPVAQQSILWCTYDISMTNLDYGPPQIEIWPTPSGLTVHVKVPDISADIAAPAAWCPDVTGQVTAQSLTFDATATMLVEADGSMKVALGTVAAEFIALDIDLYGVTGEIVEGFLSFFQGTLTSMLEEQFEQQVTVQFEQQLEKLLGPISIDQWLEVPAFIPGAPGADIQAHVRPAAVETAYGGVTFFANAAFTATDHKNIPIKGAITRAGCLKNDPVYANIEGKDYMEVALHVDAMNQMITSVWLDGGLDTELSPEQLGMGADLAEMGVENLEIKTVALMPANMNDCYPDGKLRLEIGDMQMDVKLDIMGIPLELTGYVYLAAAVEFEVAGTPGNQLVYLYYSDLDFIELHVAEVNDEWKGNEAFLQTMLQETFLPEFSGMLADNPYVVDVSQMSLAQMLPFSTDWTLVPVLHSVEPQKGQIFVRLHLEVE